MEKKIESIISFLLEIGVKVDLKWIEKNSFMDYYLLLAS